MKVTTKSAYLIGVEFARYLALLFATLSIGLFVFSNPVKAQKITPAEVYQSVDDVNNELTLFHRANFTQPKTDGNAPELTPRSPRHVIQKAREILLKVQMLRWINNLPKKPVPPIPARSITPGDVINMTKAILTEVRALRPVFGIVKSPKLASHPGKKTPTDVYQNLLRASAQIDGLGIPGTIPNDVYQVALTVGNDIKLIQNKLGLTDTVKIKLVSQKKSPANVYTHSYQLLGNLKELIQTDKFKFKGGIVMPNSRTGQITPGHVVGLLNIVLADVGALKTKLGIKAVTVFAPPQAGKTPANVYDAVEAAITMLKRFS